MSKQANVKTEDHDMLTDVMLQGVAVRTHLDLLCWLQGDLQSYLPHDIFMVVWPGEDPTAVELDLCSKLPGVRTSSLRLTHSLTDMLDALIKTWERHGHQPYRLRTHGHFPLCENQPDSGPGFSRMRSALIHGTVNKRDNTKCLYVAFSTRADYSMESLYFARLLMPYVSNALQQVPPPPLHLIAEGVSVSVSGGKARGLSSRELEIMEWVRAGKTNEVVGQILGISPFTVKNHLKRIYAKLGVSNRAHAVSILDGNIVTCRPASNDVRKSKLDARSTMQ